MQAPPPSATVDGLRYQAQRYLTKHAARHALVEQPVPLDLVGVAVVPCYDEPTLAPLLESLWRAAPPAGAVEVLLLVNSSGADGARVRARNTALLAQAAAFDESNGEAARRVYAIHEPALPARRAGVGLARKLAMDEALRRLAQNRRGAGVICSLDADCRVDSNYWCAVTERFHMAPRCTAASIYFEHDGAADAASPIGCYELYLRYYRHALRLVGHPHAFHTVGSAMAVDSAAYAAVGGMNQRQAGEDFYFLRKLMHKGGFADITNTTVRPSARASARVPFGTGQALRALQADGRLLVPGLAGFLSLQALFQGVKAGLQPDLLVAGLEPRLGAFLERQGCRQRLAEIRANTASVETFARRFFVWFDGLKVRQWLNFCCARGGKQVPVTEAAAALLAKLVPAAAAGGTRDLARTFRQLDQAAGSGTSRLCAERR